MRTGPYHPWRKWGVPSWRWPRADLLLSDLRLTALEEEHRWPLWLPVALGTGAAVYFALPVEPPILVGWTAAALFLVAVLSTIQSRDVWARALLAGLAALSLGFAAAKLREVRVSAPVLARPLVAHLTGRVTGLDWGHSGPRVVVGDVRSGRLPRPPATIRVLVRKGAEDLKVGQGIGLTAQLMPPPGPTAPGDADFGRAAYFARIGAVGFSYGAPETLPLAHPPNGVERLVGFIEAMRAEMTRRIRAALPPSRGAIASALITGERGGIEAQDESTLRDAGLAHVLAISGLHMALVGAGFFWLIRALLAAIPALALAYPIKKWAAGAALAVSSLYLIVSGATSSATRAFVMLAMMLVAILLDRPALSMRSLGLAAAILLLLRPEAITEPGFQMSFAAVASLIAVAEWERGRARLVPHGRLCRYLRGIAVASLVASLATWPFVLFFFGRASHYAVLGNLLVMPVMGLWVMPAAALSVVAMPFGLEHAPLQLLGSGIGAMLALGRLVSGLPGAVSVTPSFSHTALVLMVVGGLWLLIWRRNWRWYGILPILAGVVLALVTPRPDLLIAADARTVAVRGPDRFLYFLTPPKDRYSAARWLQRDGDSRDWHDALGGSFIHCDAVGCIARRHGLLIASSLRPLALDEDCAKADIVISAVPVLSCKKPRLVLGQGTIAQGGGYAVTLSPLKALSINQWRGARPWVEKPKPQ